MPSWNASFLWIIFLLCFLWIVHFCLSNWALLARPHLCGVGAEEFGNNSYGWSNLNFWWWWLFFFFDGKSDFVLSEFCMSIGKDVWVTEPNCNLHDLYILHWQQWIFYAAVLNISLFFNFFFFFKIQDIYHLSDDMMLWWKPQVRSYTSFISPNYLMLHFLSIVQGIWAWMISMSDGLLHFYFGWLSAI